MAKIFSVICLLITMGSFAQSTKQNTVPQELLTDDSLYWTISTLSSVNYVNTTPGYNYGTTTSGGGMLVQFKFLPNNRFRFQLYVQANSYGTRSEAWTEVEGKVTFTKDAKNQDIFITSAEKGIYRTYRNGTSAQRPIPEAELKGQHSCTFLWQKTSFKDDPNNIYLLTVDMEEHPDADVNNPKTINPSWVSKFQIPAKK